MTKTGKAVLWVTVGVGAVAGAGVVWAHVSPTTFPFKSLLPQSGSSASGVSVTVSGYALGATGSAAPVGSGLHIADGEQVTGIAVARLSSTVAQNLQVGVRAWIVQLGANLDPNRFLVVGNVNGTVEGHLFVSASSTSAEVASATLSPGGGQQEMMFSSALQPSQIAWANPNAPSHALGVIWAAGPYSAVAALPDLAGTLPQGQIAYAVTQNALLFP